MLHLSLLCRVLKLLSHSTQQSSTRRHTYSTYGTIEKNNVSYYVSFNLHLLTPTQLSEESNVQNS